MATVLAEKPSLPPLLDPKLKTECECDPAPIVVDHKAINMGLQCMKCGHEVKVDGILRLLRYALKKVTR